jgi:hypothetical protein
MQTCDGSQAVLSRCIVASKLMSADDLYGAWHPHEDGLVARYLQKYWASCILIVVEGLVLMA